MGARGGLVSFRRERMRRRPRAPATAEMLTVTLSRRRCRTFGGPEGQPAGSPKRNFVIQIRRRPWATARAPAPGRSSAAIASFIRYTLVVAPVGTEHDDFTTELLQHYLGGVPLLAGIVGPFAGLQRALDVELGALLQKPLDDLDEPVIKNDDPMPFGALLSLAGVAVLPALGCSDRELSDLGPVIRRADFGIPSQISNEDHLIYGCDHFHLPNFLQRRLDQCRPVLAGAT